MGTNRNWNEAKPTFLTICDVRGGFFSIPLFKCQFHFRKSPKNIIIYLIVRIIFVIEYETMETSSQVIRGVIFEDCVLSICSNRDDDASCPLLEIISKYRNSSDTWRSAWKLIHAHSFFPWPNTPLLLVLSICWRDALHLFGFFPRSFLFSLNLNRCRLSKKNNHRMHSRILYAFLYGCIVGRFKWFSRRMRRPAQQQRQLFAVQMEQLRGMRVCVCDLDSLACEKITH